MKTKPIKTLEDFKGMKIVATSPAMSETIKQLGGAPVPLTEADVYTALERGMVDGRFNMYESLVIFKVMEVTKYRTNNVNFDVLGGMVVMNKKTWNSLPPDIQKIIDDCSGVGFSRRVAIAADNVEVGMTKVVLGRDKKVGNPEPYVLPEAEKERWKKVVMQVHEAWAERLEKDGLPGKALMQDIYTWTKNYSSK